MVKTGEICKKCIYYGGQTETCDYRLMTNKSRLVTDGKRIDPQYCDKYVAGKREFDAKKSHEYYTLDVYHKF